MIVSSTPALLKPGTCGLALMLMTLTPATADGPQIVNRLETIEATAKAICPDTYAAMVSSVAKNPLEDMVPAADAPPQQEMAPEEELWADNIYQASAWTVVSAEYVGRWIQMTKAAGDEATADLDQLQQWATEISAMHELATCLKPTPEVLAPIPEEGARAIFEDAVAQHECLMMYEMVDRTTQEIAGRTTTEGLGKALNAIFEDLEKNAGAGPCEKGE